MRPKKVLASERKRQDRENKKFLQALVNAQTEAKDASGVIFHDYHEFLPRAPRSPQEAQQNFPLLLALMYRWKNFSPHGLPKGVEAYQRGIVAEMRDRLLTVWEAGKAGDVEAARWRLEGFKSFMHEVMTAGSNSGPPAPDATPHKPDATARKAAPPDARLSQALAYLGRNLRKLKVCARQGCPHPFFVGNREEDQYCSYDCTYDRKRKGPAVLQRGEPQPAVKKVAEESIGSQGEQLTIAEPDLKAFILDVVNTDDKEMDDPNLRFFSKYPAFFPTKDKDIEAVVALAKHNPAMFEKMKEEWPWLHHRSLMRELHRGLRGLWQEEDTTAERLLFELRSIVHHRVDINRGGDRALQPPPVDAPIQQALVWVGQHLSKLRRCRNVRCHGPRTFFVADTKEQFCPDDECRHVGEKASKLRSWEKHRQEWRKKRSKSQETKSAKAKPKKLARQTRQN